MKRSFFLAAVASILLYGCTTWTLTKRLEKKLDSNYTRMLRAILNKSWRQHPTRHQLYGHLPPITKTIQVRRTRHAGHCWRNRDELISDVLLWTPTHGRAKAGRPAWTYIQQLCEDTGRSPEDLPEAMNDREKWRERVRISVLPARHDDNDDLKDKSLVGPVARGQVELEYFSKIQINIANWTEWHNRSQEEICSGVEERRMLKMRINNRPLRGICKKKKKTLENKKNIKNSWTNVFTQPLCQRQDVTQNQFFKQSKSLNSEFSFSKNSCLAKAKENSLSYYLPIAGERRDGFMPFQRELASSEM